jgi:translation initiation factor 3 subunit F
VHVALDVDFADPKRRMRAWTGKSVAIGSADLSKDAKAAAAAAVAAPRDEEKDDAGSTPGSRRGSEGARRPPPASPPAATYFQEISLTNVLDAAERVGVGLLTSETSGEVFSEREGLVKTVKKLSAALERTSAFVLDAADGKTEPDAEVGRLLADALASVPRLTRDQFEKVFGDAIQDVLLVMYLSNVTKMQLVLAEKLQTASLLV